MGARNRLSTQGRGEERAREGGMSMGGGKEGARNDVGRGREEEGGKRREG